MNILSVISYPLLIRGLLALMLATFSTPNKAAGRKYGKSLKAPIPEGGIVIGSGAPGNGIPAGSSGGSLQISLSTKGTTCGLNNGTILVAAVGGRPPYTYFLGNNAPTNSPYFNGLASGTYSVGVTDSLGNSITASIQVANTYSSPSVSILSYKYPTGCNTADGSFTLGATGGMLPYGYSMDNIHFQADPTFSNLTGGQYYLTVRDGNGCQASVPPTGFHLLPALGNCIAFRFSGSDFSCSTGPGVIDISSVSPGDPCTYSLDGIHYQTTGHFPNLSAGLYTVYLKDASGSIALFSDVILSVCPVSFDFVVKDRQCNLQDGSILVNPTGGLAPFTYTLDGVHFQSSPAFSGLTTGNYTITVMDANGNADSRIITVGSSCPAVTVKSSNATCGVSDGILTASGSGGNAPFQYSLDGIHFQTDTVFTGLAPGKYILVIRDTGGFTNQVQAIVGDNCISLHIVVRDATCGLKNGKIIPETAGGFPPYSYSLDGTNFEVTDSLTGLSAGTYQLTVRDAKGQITVSTLTIGREDAPAMEVAVSPASCMNHDGLVSINASAGTAPYRYSVNGTLYLNSNQFGNLDTGAYQVTIRDFNGCIATRSVTVPLLDNLYLLTGGNSQICEGSPTHLQVNSNGSSFSWYPAGGLDDPSRQSPVASPTETTLYHVWATLGICKAQDSALVNILPLPRASAGNGASICFGKSVQLSGSGGLSYHWSPPDYLDDTASSNPTVRQPSHTTTYFLWVTDQNGCTSAKADSVMVVVSPPAKLFAGNDTSVVTNQTIQLRAEDIDNTGFIQYNWSPSRGLNNPNIANPLATISSDITYMVVASSADLCVGADSIHIRAFSEADLFLPNAFSPNSDGRNDVLRPVAVGIREFKFFAVYTRWGQQVYYSANPLAGWDGKFQGRTLNAGTFVWMCSGVDFNGNSLVRKGTVVLVR